METQDVYTLFGPAVLAQEDAHKAARIVALWQRPAVPESVVPEMLGLAERAWHECKLANDAPPRFRLGKREFVRVADLLEWLERKARAARPEPQREAA